MAPVCCGLLRFVASKPLPRERRRETERAASGRRSGTPSRAEAPADRGRGRPSDEVLRSASRDPARRRRQGVPRRPTIVGPTRPSGGLSASSCPASQPLSSAPAVAAPAAAGNTPGGGGGGRAGMPAASRPSTTADARSQPCTGASRSRATSTPSPRARSRAPTTRRKRRVPPESPSGPIIARPTSPGARSDTTPMAILPPAKPTARSLASIGPILRDRAAGRTARRDTPRAWRNRTDADVAAPASCSTR